MRKFLVSFLIVVLVVLSFSEVVVRLGGWPSSPTEEKALQEAVDKFNEMHKGEIKIVYEPIPGDYRVKLTAMLSAGTAPDIFYLDVNWAEEFFSKGIIQPLDLYIKKHGLDLEDFYPSLLNAFKYKGRIYGIAKDFSTLALFYNKKMFDEAGLKYPDATWTWDDLLEAAKKLTRDLDGDGKIDVWGLALYPNAFNRVIPFIFQAGGKIVNEDLSTSLGEPEAIEGIKFYFDLHNKYKVAVSPQDVGAGWLGDAFGKEKVAMVMSGPWMLGFLRDNFPNVDYGVAELPKYKERATMIYTVCYAIPKTCKHKDEAFIALKYLVSEGMKIFTERLGVLPSRKSLAEKELNDPIKGAFYKGVAYGIPWKVPTPSGISSKLIDEINTRFLKIWNGEMSVEDAVKEIVQHYDEWVK